MKKRLGWIAILGVLILASLACRLTSTLPELKQQPTATSSVVRQATLPPSEPVATPTLMNQALLSFADRDALLANLYERVAPGVVFIATTTDGEIESLGSGFVYDREGHIITNFHVVDGATDLEVDFPSGIKVRAEVIGQDLDSDLAVIKVDVPADALVPLPLADSDQVRVGQTAIAIGNPFGLTGTMTVGIVSAKGRTLESLRQAEGGTFFSAGDVIQTDASINPGNSGGPLLNLAGEVIGVNRAIRTTGTTITGEPVNSGIGFAVSSNIVRRVVPVLIAQGKYDYPYLGISSREMLTLEQIEALGLPRQTGAYIVSVTPGSPADRAGLRGGDQPTRFAGLPAGGDLIIAIDGQPVQAFSDMLSYLMKYKSPGDTVVLTIIRDNQEKEVSVTLGKRP
ncbi:MAG: trypsin-like peptidase domain-containing protein [Thermanaerothrix sp.]|nr:trypsin-like peptidase domain-containing protein [Thermanaerothrix sp.]